MSTILVAAVVFFALGYTVYRMVKARKKGSACAGCPSCGSCTACSTKTAR